MRRSDYYHHKAVECLRLAQEFVDAGSKALMLEMAQTWVKLSEQVKAAETEIDQRE
jgi:hypothetical protein